MRRCCVFFHAHPDDEALLTAGTMARLAAEGERVVLVVATAGERGLTGDPRLRGDVALGEARMRELRTSAAALGCARVVGLGYVDSGSDPTAPAPGGFARAEVAEAAERLADLLREEQADLVTVYDRVGGYGHLDHVQVHRVGMEAARLAGTPRVLQATVDRDLLLWAARLAARLPGTGVDPHALEGAYATGAEITHRIDVRGFAGAKRRAMAAHASQHSGGRAPRTLQLLLGLPFPVFRRVLGTEWFIDPTMPPGRRATHPLERG